MVFARRRLCVPDRRRNLCQERVLRTGRGFGFILFWLLPLWVAVTAFVATPRPADAQPEA
jgi:hypothetical protein